MRDRLWGDYMAGGRRWVSLASYGFAALIVVAISLLSFQAWQLDSDLGPHELAGESFFVGQTADYLVDQGEIAVIDAATLPGILQRMKPNEGKAPGVGLRYYQGQKLWLSMAVPQLGTEAERWSVRLENTRVREARLVVIKDGRFTERDWRYDSLPRRAGLESRVPIFEFPKAELEGARILLGYSSLGAMRAAVYVETARATASHETWQAMKYGLLVGSLTAFAIYLLVIGARLGERGLIFAAGLNFFAAIFIGGVGGYFHSMLLAPWPKMADALLYSTQPVMMTFWVLLVVAYLDLLQRTPRLGIFLVVVALVLPLQGVLTVATLLGYPIPFITDNGTPVLIGLVGGLGPLIWYSIRGDIRALRLLASFAPIAIASIIRLVLYLVPGSPPELVALFESFVDIVATMGLLAVVIVLDIQRREKLLRSEARRNELRFRDYAEITADSVFEVGPDGLIRSSAGPLSRTLSITAGQQFAELLPDLAPPLAESLFDQPRRAIELPVSLGTGEERRWLSLSSMPIADEEGRPDGFRAVVTDISVSVAERDNDARRNTLAALGQLAGGIAHEVNNLLHPIISLSRRVAENHVGDPDGKRLLELVVASGIRAGEIVKSVLRAYTPDSFTGGAVPLEIAVRDAVETVRATIPATCKFDVRIDPVASPEVRVGEMIQVLSNLASNSIRATGGDGTLTLSLMDGASGPVLSFSDNGSGMPEAIRQRASEPFVTGSAGGIGLGLSVVRRIVSAWRATLEIESEEGRGTTIRIRLPRA